MADIASLGLKVSTQGVQQAKTELEGLAVAGGKAEQATRKVASAEKELSDSVRASSSIRAEASRRAREEVAKEASSREANWKVIRAQFAEEKQIASRRADAMAAFGPALAAQERANAGLVREHGVRERLSKLLETSRGQRILEASATGVGATGMARFGLAMGAGAKSAKELQFATRGLPAQFTDIATSLASGQRPFQVLLQQGGQIKDIFGGVGPALRAMGGYVVGLINPLTLAAAAVGLLVFAWKDASDRADAFNRAIILTGNYARTSSADLRDMAARLDDVTSATSGAAADAVAQVTATGRFTKDQIEGVARAALAMRDAAGVAIEDTIKEFVRLADDPARAIEQLNKSQHLLTDETKKQIKSLQDQGREAEATALAVTSVADAITNRAGKVTASLSGWALMWRDVKIGAGEAFDVIRQGFQDSETGAQSAQTATASFLSTLNGTVGIAVGLYAKLNQLRSSAATSAKDFSDVISNSDTVSGDFARTRGLPENFGLNVAPPEKEAKGTGRGRSRSGGRSARALPDFSKTAAADAARLAEMEDRATESFKDMAAMLAGPLAQAQRDHEVAVARLNKLAEESPVAAEGLTEALRLEAEQYARTTDQIKKQLDPIGQVLEAQKFELDMIGKSNAEREVMNALLAEGIDLRGADAQAALAQARANQAEAESRQQSIDLMDDFRQGAADALTDFVTGAKSAKDALKDFFDSLAQQITQAIANQWIKQLFGPQGSDGAGTQGGGFLSAIMGLFSADGGWGGIAKGAAFPAGVTAFANGGVVDRATMFTSGGKLGVYGEAGPEAILPLHRGPDGKLGVRMAANDDAPKRGDTYIQTSFVLPQTMTPQSQAQIAQGQQRVASRATSRNR